jgi:5-methylcytosine-specific restriction enzyme subunit McrC
MAIGNTNTIIIREYESVRIGERWDAPSKTISRRDAAGIANYQACDGRAIFDLGYNSAKATNWVGTFGLSDRAIEVVPKIDNSEGVSHESASRENLLFMVARAGYISVTPAEVARLAASEKTLLAAFLELYVEKLAREWHLGPTKSYIDSSENRPFLRGKPLFGPHIRENHLHRNRFFTFSDEFITNNPISRLLKAALLACRSQRLSEPAARTARTLLVEFDEVSAAAPSADELVRLTVDRQIARFAPLVNLAKLILRAASPAKTGSGGEVYSLMYDMNEVFELYIATELKDTLAGQHYTVMSQLGGAVFYVGMASGSFSFAQTSASSGARKFSVSSTRNGSV